MALLKVGESVGFAWEERGEEIGGLGKTARNVVCRPKLLDREEDTESIGGEESR